LRIDYAVLQIRDDKKRNYTIQALALEFGFTSAESFSSAFFKNTGIKPTYYIEQLKPHYQILNKIAYRNSGISIYKELFLFLAIKFNVSLKTYIPKI
jgi:AraC-like DNA-binding protein